MRSGYHRNASRINRTLREAGKIESPLDKLVNQVNKNK